jgi:hypothetical protein
MYRHQAVQLLEEKREQYRDPDGNHDFTDIKPWMVDAVLAADRLAHEDMGIDTTPDTNQGEMFVDHTHD